MIYEYSCDCGNRWEESLKLKDRFSPVFCECGKRGTRLLSAVPSFFRKTHPDVKQDMHELVAGVPGNITEL